MSCCRSLGARFYISRQLQRKPYCLSGAVRAMSDKPAKRRTLPWDASKNASKTKSKAPETRTKQPTEGKRKRAATSATRESPAPPEPPSFSYHNENYQVTYVRHIKDVEKALALCRGDVVGFDMEWKVTFVKGQPPRPTALIQICNDRHICLFHITHMGSLPVALKNFLEDRTVIKTGVNIMGDARKLNKDYGVEMEGCLDIGKFGGQALLGTERMMSLRNLVTDLFGVTLDKSNDGPRKGDWEANTFTEDQIFYAANDVYAHYKCYNALIAKITPPAMTADALMELPRLPVPIVSFAEDHAIRIAKIEEERMRALKVDSAKTKENNQFFADSDGDIDGTSGRENEKDVENKDGEESDGGAGEQQKSFGGKAKRGKRSSTTQSTSMVEPRGDQSQMAVSTSTTVKISPVRARQSQGLYPQVSCESVDAKMAAAVRMFSLRATSQSQQTPGWHHLLPHGVSPGMKGSPQDDALSNQNAQTIVGPSEYDAGSPARLSQLSSDEKLPAAQAGPASYPDPTEHKPREKAVKSSVASTRKRRSVESPSPASRLSLPSDDILLAVEPALYPDPTEHEPLEKAVESPAPTRKRRSPESPSPSSRLSLPSDDTPRCRAGIIPRSDRARTSGEGRGVACSY
ncbi:uncharacterized protein EV422DRAFT_200258 [Fimicolochytrium jonesii]|uniref:uncharacterized protein n=1 Tax=Fimicolochytrium jonesii TaxID=1396493 RepID=UPI0022FEE9DA|nr:uncharacterized protein EV422DRAFT_200258 [Fimicolochytrium jonesii]KAI8817965.1 hypothetical protein EV422DRAFT_200258 [Fimicolochytrium jonesii]